MKKILSCLSAILLVGGSGSAITGCSVQFGKHQNQHQNIPNIIQAQNFTTLTKLGQTFNELNQPFTLKDYFNKHDSTLSDQSLFFYADGLNPQQLTPDSLKGSFNSSPYTLVNQLNDLFDLKMQPVVKFDHQAIQADAKAIKTFGDLTNPKYLTYQVSNFDQLSALQLTKVSALVSPGPNINVPDDWTNFTNFINIFDSQSVAKISSPADLSNYFKISAFDYDQANKKFKDKVTTIRTIKLDFSDGKQTKSIRAMIKLDNINVFGDYWDNFLISIQSQFKAANDWNETNYNWVEGIKFLLNQTDLFSFKSQPNFPALVLDGNDFRAYFEQYTKDQKLYEAYAESLKYKQDVQVAQKFFDYVKNNHQEEILTTTDVGKITPIFAQARDYTINDLKNDRSRVNGSWKITSINDEKNQAYQDSDLVKNENFLTIKTAETSVEIIYKVLIYNQLNKNTAFDDLKSLDANALKTFLSAGQISGELTWDYLGKNYYVSEISQPYQAKNQIITPNTTDFSQPIQLITNNLMNKHYDGKTAFLNPDWWKISLINQTRGQKNQVISFILK